MAETLRPTRTLNLHAAGDTNIGRRKHNEDAVLVRGDLGLFLVADGAGGHNAGNVASAIATTSIANWFEATQDDYAMKGDFDAFGLAVGARRIAIAIQKANRDIIEIAKTNNKYLGMGTTIVGMFINPVSALLHVGYVGDSRCYRLRDGRLEAMTHDHSLLNDVLELRPDIGDAALARLPRHVVTRALGMGEKLRVEVNTHAIMPGDRYLLCSDGLSDALEDEQIADVLRQPQSPDDLAKRLIKFSLEEGAEDNVAALVLECELVAGVPLFEKRVVKVRPPRVTQLDPQERAGGSVPPAYEEGDPEIIVGEESEIDASSVFHVVPAEAARPSLLDALGGLTELSRLRPVAVEPTVIVAPERCKKCDGEVAHDALVCPHCGEPRKLSGR